MMYFWFCDLDLRPCCPLNYVLRSSFVIILIIIDRQQKKKKSTFSYQEIFNIDNNIHCYTRDKTPMQSSSMDIKLITIKFRKVATSKGGDKLRLIYLFSSKSLSFYYITCLLK